jgi:hypothetical protein
MKRILLAAAALLLSHSAFAASTTFPVINGNGGLQQNNAEQNSGGAFSPHSVPEVAGAAVTVQNPMPSADANNAAFHGATVLTPGTPVSVTAAGYSFAWVCTTPGLGSITLPDSSVLPYFFFSNSGGLSRDAFTVLNVSVGAASGCTFWNLH